MSVPRGWIWTIGRRRQWGLHLVNGWPRLDRPLLNDDRFEKRDVPLISFKPVSGILKIDRFLAEIWDGETYFVSRELNALRRNFDINDLVSFLDDVRCDLNIQRFD